MALVRAAASADEAALAAICVATGDAAYRSVAPDLIADIWLRPYLRFAMPWCRVAEDDAGVAGYIVAADDTQAFASRTEAAWWPALRRQHPLPDPADERPRAQLVRRLHAGVLVDLDFLPDYPAHLHINLLPRAQGIGLGQRLMASLLAALRDARVGGVHLGVSAQNTRAIAFYEQQGFVPLEQHPWGAWMGLRLAMPGVTA
jgi:ribosomal protein S18 acetylase RimI-like enzyme